MQRLLGAKIRRVSLTEASLRHVMKSCHRISHFVKTGVELKDIFVFLSV